MNVIAFGASTSRQSINKQLAGYAASLLPNTKLSLLDLNDYEMPLFSEDKEAEIGQPEQAKKFLADIAVADVLIISFAEHNGSYSAAYKNIFDWASRIDRNVFQNKPMVLLSTSPGPGGAGTVLAAAVNSAPYFAGDVKGSLSIPKFNDNFDRERNTLVNAEIKDQLTAQLHKLL